MKNCICIMLVVATSLFYAQAQVAVINKPVSEWENATSKFSIPLPESAFSKVRVLKPDEFLVKEGDVNTKLKKQMDEMMAFCPLLQAPVSIELEAARKSHSDALLNWKTENALYSRQYVIERSFDDTLHFETVNYVWPKSEYARREKYDLDDANNYNRVSYYRVKLEMHSGKIIYSNVAEVKGYTINKMAVYPNPAHDVVTFMAYEDANKIVGVKITDASGRLVWQKSGLQPKQFLQERVNVSALSNGLYIVKFELVDKTQKTVSFIKQ
jgi:hypothetical protein